MFMRSFPLSPPFGDLGTVAITFADSKTNTVTFWPISALVIQLQPGLAPVRASYTLLFYGNLMLICVIRWYFFLTGHSIGVPLELCPPSKNNKVSVEHNWSFSYVSKCT